MAWSVNERRRIVMLIDLGKVSEQTKFKSGPKTDPPPNGGQPTRM
jgi:hypothetical protein